MNEAAGHHGPFRVLFAGGGTGGHLYPALAIAEQLAVMRPESEIVFAGSSDRIESRVVPARGHRFETIWISGFRRRLSFSTLLFPLKLAVAFVQSVILVVRVRPDVVVGTGGYVCGPVVLAAWLLGKPTLVQEQNSTPGVTTRLLARIADEVHITFERSRAQLRRRDGVILSGNPTRSAVGSVGRAEGAGFFGLLPERRILLIFGGSQGSSRINNVMLGLLPELQAMGVQILWQTGEIDHARIKQVAGGTEQSEASGVRVLKFIEHMEYAYAACDLALCRAGATTVAELTRAGVPSVLVPYPFAAADHQTENARAMADAGAAVVCPDAMLETRLPGVLRTLIGQPERLRQMSAAALSLARPEAATRIAAAIIHLGGHNDG